MKWQLKTLIAVVAVGLLATAPQSAQATVIVNDGNTGLDWIVQDEEGFFNADGNFAFVGTWERQVLGGNAFQGIGRRSNGGQGENTATWTFNNLDNGVYEVAASWQTRGAEATNSPFSINGDTPILVDQRSNPTGPPSLFDLGGAGNPSINEIFFETLSIDTEVDAGTLTVFLTNNADGRVLADAIAIRKVADLSVPEPATAGLGLLALGGLVLRRRRNIV